MTIPDITKIMDTAPSAPERSDRANFADKGDAYMAYLEGLADELNTLKTQINQTSTAMNTTAEEMEANKVSAQSAETIALATANFKGAWSGLTGAHGGASDPTSCSHEGRFWILTSAVADITSKEPGVVSEWTVIALGFSEVYKMNSATLSVTELTGKTITNSGAMGQVELTWQGVLASGQEAFFRVDASSNLVIKAPFCHLINPF